MKTKALSTCFCTTKVDLCKEFYSRYFSAKPVFDCGWYVTIKIDRDGPEISFIQPQQKDTPVFSGAGVMLNFKVDDVDTEYTRLTGEGLQIAMPLEDHPWGDRGFSIIDPIGNSVYVYSDRKPSKEFEQYVIG
ncbi:VOC family protein [Motiliproteus sp. MSK22-1]|uniref:VOC family protein n=1 Tax=Motiliproteus sp. MSK22-1 TaxID=1897630 RepID=UPI000975535E|nr:VOC family protein [Motiliproteus sp. MSK22-1]OMH37995.1 glyoxalase [Motiliproteus sp. MSK22-1]